MATQQRKKVEKKETVIGPAVAVKVFPMPRTPETMKEKNNWVAAGPITPTAMLIGDVDDLQW